MIMQMHRVKGALVALGLAAAGVVGATSVEASVLQFDINGVHTQASGAFSTNFTGTLQTTHKSNTDLSVLIDGSQQNSFGGLSAGTVEADFDIAFVNGAITGGTLEVSVTVGGNTDTFTADFLPGGGISSGGSQVGFIITGDFSNGQFSGNTFGGIDVSYWASHPSGNNPWGDLIQFGFTPDANNSDSDANIDMFVVIPLPAPVWMGLAGLGGVIVLRRRSLRN